MPARRLHCLTSGRVLGLPLNAERPVTLSRLHFILQSDVDQEETARDVAGSGTFFFFLCSGPNKVKRIVDASLLNYSIHSTTRRLDNTYNKWQMTTDLL
ncbi:hypothetical protein NDU88_002282 [Pleurodeles waltl]|uniref:Uncharacterized protein n=1 Tax=Pleurodeles waltl TaxID=8319 RepID=A0AAV7W444_PLEWA|nr:hypothetical protein NDU88_002282 [Pleurodeles waltl]